MVNLNFKTTFLVFIIFCLYPASNAADVIDSLLIELSQSNSKSTIYNQLAEATIEDSLELSMNYAKLALQDAKSEKNIREEGIALFNQAGIFHMYY